MEAQRNKDKYTYLFFLLTTFIVCLPIFFNPMNLGINDFDYNFFQISVAKESILKFGEFPLWNPYDQGGVPLLGTSFSRVLNPFMIFYLIFPAIIALKIEIFIMVFLGQLGSYLFLKTYKFDQVVATLSASLFSLSSYFALNVAQGHHEFIPGMLIPFLFYFYRQNDLKNILGTAVTLSWMFLGGAVYLVVISMTTIGMFHLFRVIKRRSILELKVLVATLALFMGISAIKLFPVLDYMSQFPRVIHDFSGWSVASMIHSLINPDQYVLATTNMEKFYEAIKELTWLSNSTSVYTGIDHGWDENGVFLGIGFSLLMIFGFIINLYHEPRKSIHVAFILNLLICFGDRLAYGPWKLMKLFPIFESMRHATRFRVIFLILGCYYIAYGLNYLVKRFKHSQTVHYTLIAFCFINLFSVIYVSNRIFSQSFPFEGFTDLVRSKELTYTKAWTSNHRYYLFSEKGFYPAFLTNTGVAYDKENQTVPLGVKTPKHERYMGEIYPEEFKIVEQTNNSVSFTSKDTSISLNRNYIKGWVSTDCKFNKRTKNINVYHCDDDISQVEYRPLSFIIGCGISVVTFIFLIFMVLRFRRFGRIVS
ncbi:MAG: hypothetical protein GY909_12650 [Oligoflexia bacterium]|nr:hypothetical protein [Oligoflexia bacterium]